MAIEKEGQTESKKEENYLGQKIKEIHDWASNARSALRQRDGERFEECIRKITDFQICVLVTDWPEIEESKQSLENLLKNIDTCDINSSYEDIDKVEKALLTFTENFYSKFESIDKNFDV